MSTNGQWRGIIEEYRDLLDLPAGIEAVTLREGGTPLVHSEWLSGLTGGQVWLKVEGNNPTASFKDRGMTAAISLARHEGAEAVVCASTGNTSASMAASASGARVGRCPSACRAASAMSATAGSSSTTRTWGESDRATGVTPRARPWWRWRRPWAGPPRGARR